MAKLTICCDCIIDGLPMRWEARVVASEEDPEEAVKVDHPVIWSSSRDSTDMRLTADGNHPLLRSLTGLLQDHETREWNCE